VEGLVACSHMGKNLSCFGNRNRISSGSGNGSD
jgi:hypothetical protein